MSESSEAAEQIGRPWAGCLFWGAALVFGTVAFVLLIFAIVVYPSRAQALAIAQAQAIEKTLADARAEGAPLTVEEIEAYYPTDPQIEEATRHWQRAIANFDANEPIPSIDDDDARTFLERHRPAIEAAHDARRAGAVARFPMHFEDGFFADRRYLSTLRTLANVVALDAQVRLADGEIDGAVEDVLTEVAISESVSTAPCLLSQLIRVACFARASDSAEQAFRSGKLNDEQLLEIGEAFARPRFDDGLRRAIVGDRFSFVQALTSDDPPEDEQLAKIRSLGPRDVDLADGLKLFRRAELACERGMLAVVSEGRALEDEIVSFAGTPESLALHAGTTAMFPAVGAAAVAHLRAETISVLTETAAACERFRLAHGELPPTLDALVPEYLSAPPIDPFDEKPLRYVIREDGATLYSVSKDFSDDGGLVDFEDADGGPCDDLFFLRPDALTKPK